jgi:hypothetical protein
MKLKTILLITVVLILPFSALLAQEKSDTIKKAGKKEKPAVLKPYHWNVIKFNPTPMLIFANINNITFSYERLVAKNHSVALQLGYLIFPRLVDDTLINLISLSGKSKYGVNIALDYRYYPWSRNRRPAPDGLYLGAFVSYYGFNFSNNFDVLYTTVDQHGTLNGKLNVFNVGMTLGYQFIFWKRVSLDLLLFGPAISRYSGRLELTGDLDQEQIKNLDKEMVAKLLDRFPLLGQLFSGETLEFTGSRTKLAIGFRYSIQLGFHF